MSKKTQSQDNIDIASPQVPASAQLSSSMTGRTPENAPAADEDRHATHAPSLSGRNADDAVSGATSALSRDASAAETTAKALHAGDAASSPETDVTVAPDAGNTDDAGKTEGTAQAKPRHTVADTPEAWTAGDAKSGPGDEEDLSLYETSAREAGLELCGSDIGSDDFVHPADRAEHLEQLPLNKQLCVLTHLSTEEAAEALAELDEEVAGDVLENMDADDAARLIAEMDPDDAVDILDEVEEGHRDILLSNLPADDAEELRMLLSFDPDTAAGVMNTDIIMVSVNSTVDEAIQLIRSELEEKEMPYYVYVVDSQETLEGVISLRDLMLAKPGTILSDMVNKQDVISVQFDTDKAEVARLLGHYNFLCLPVVDRDEHLMGVVTHDDVLDIIQDEASSDMLGMVGAGQDENVDTPWTRSVRIRLPWLVINMCTSSLSAFIVSMFEGSIAQMALLAVLMPMVANQAGNTGQQALAVMIRQLATESFDARRSWGAVFRESKIGLGTGIFMAVLAYTGVMFLSHNSMLAMVMGVALLLDMLLGAIAGGAIPLVLRALGRDPAQASSIFLTALTDSGGFFIFLGLATTFLL